MLNGTERDVLRKAAHLHGQSVAQIRRRIATGFLDCIKDQEVDYEMGYGPAWDLRLSRDEPSVQEMRLIGGLAKNYEDALDRLCALWVHEILVSADDLGSNIGYEKYMDSLTGDPDTWCP